MKPNNKKIVKYFVTGILALIVFFPLNAQVNGKNAPTAAISKDTATVMSDAAFSEIDTSSRIYISQNTIIAGKENIFVKPSATRNLQKKNAALSEIDTSSCIYISPDAVIVGKENIFVKPPVSRSLQKNTVETHVRKYKKNNTSQPVKKAVTEEKPKITVCTLPFTPVCLSYSSSDKAFAMTVPSQRLNNSLFTNKTEREIIYSIVEKSDLPLYSPELRQKFSPAATQCGILTSFGRNSPSLS